MSQSTDELGDFIQGFQIGDLDIRGRLVRLDRTFCRAIKDHAHPSTVNGLIGEAMVLSSILGSALKYDGVFTLQAQGNGPVPLVMADITSDGAMRACARVREGETVPDSGHQVSIPQLLGAGHLAFTVDQGPDTDRYQGITALEGSTMADCAQNYFRTSEQLETAIAIVSDASAPETAKAAGLMIQRMPGTGDSEQQEEDWRRSVILMSSVRADELLDPDLQGPDILLRLFNEDGIRLLDRRELRHECRCSDLRVRQTVLSFPKSELEELADDGMITVTCEFCRVEYAYSLDSLDDMHNAQEENR